MWKIKKAASPKVPACEGKTAPIKLINSNQEFAVYQPTSKRCRRCIALLQLKLALACLVPPVIGAVLVWRLMI